MVKESVIPVREKPPFVHAVTRRLVTDPYDGTVKIVSLSGDGHYYHTVLFRKDDGTLKAAISSQLGCRIQCDFSLCERFVRNHEAWEIDGQIGAAKDLCPELKEIAFVGTGESSYNLENILPVIVKYHRLGFRITVSTVGLLGKLEPMLEAFKDLENVHVRISGHYFGKRRVEYMPGTRGSSLEKALDVLHPWSKKTGRRVVFNHLLMSGKNTCPADILRLKELTKGRFSVRLSLINSSGEYECPDISMISSTKKYLESHGIQVETAYSKGLSIRAGMGQLRNHLPGRMTNSRACVK